MSKLALTVRLTVACLLVPVVSILTGCQSPGPPKQALDAAAISAVQMEIKRQVGIYTQASQKRLKVDPAEFACGNGNIDFDITTVKAELTVTAERNSKAGLSLGIPWNGVTIGPSGEATKGSTNTQVLTYNLWLTDTSIKAFNAANKAANKEEVSQAELETAPIASVLLSLREALISGAKKRGDERPPCFTTYNPEKPTADAGNAFKLGLVYSQGGKYGLQIKVGIVDLTSSTEWKSSTGNTLTVAFVQRGLEDVKRAREAVDVECKYPKTPADPACMEALKKLQAEQKKAGGNLVPP